MSQRFRSFVLLSLAISAALTAAVRADAPASAPASTQPTTEPAVLDANDKPAIDKATDTEAIIEGKISTAAWSRSGKVMVAHFDTPAGTELTAVLFSSKREAFDKAFHGDTAAAITGAKVRVKGTVKLWGTGDNPKRPEIILDAPDQLTILQPAPATQPAAMPTTAAAP